jgi:hypothetical protein
VLFYAAWDSNQEPPDVWGFFLREETKMKPVSFEWFEEFVRRVAKVGKVMEDA